MGTWTVRIAWINISIAVLTSAAAVVFSGCPVSEPAQQTATPGTQADKAVQDTPAPDTGTQAIPGTEVPALDITELIAKAQADPDWPEEGSINAYA